MADVTAWTLLPPSAIIYLFMDIARLNECLRALSDPTRRRVVELLAGGARRAGDLAGATGVTAPVMSKHLRVLLASGLVDDERSVTDARVRLFFLRREVLEQVAGWFDEIARTGPSPPA